jgi:hypothetical protein
MRFSNSHSPGTKHLGWFAPHLICDAHRLFYSIYGYIAWCSTVQKCDGVAGAVRQLLSISSDRSHLSERRRSAEMTGPAFMKPANGHPTAGIHSIQVADDNNNAGSTGAELTCCICSNCCVQLCIWTIGVISTIIKRRSDLIIPDPLSEEDA